MDSSIQIDSITNSCVIHVHYNACFIHLIFIYGKCSKVSNTGNRIKIPSDMFLYLSFVRTHTKFGIKIFEIDMVTEI